MAAPLEARLYNPLNPNPWDTTFGHNENCTLDTCDVETSIFTYQPSLAANAVFIALFGTSLVLHAAQGIRWRTWVFTVAMVLGCMAEMVGYGGRIMMHANPFSFVGFMVQIVCITTAPVFYTAAIYVTLSKIVVFLGPEHSRFSPALYYWIFIPCDLVSLALQATGGAMSANSSGSDKVGVDISLAGLSFQVCSLVVFVLLVVDFAFRYRRSKHREILPTTFKCFVFVLSLAITLILVRCVYRIDELSDGYKGPLIHNEGLFIGLEGVMIVIATFVLNVAQRGLAFMSSERNAAIRMTETK